MRPPEKGQEPSLDADEMNDGGSDKSVSRHERIAEFS